MGDGVSDIPSVQRLGGRKMYFLSKRTKREQSEVVHKKWETVPGTMNKRCVVEKCSSN